MKRIVLLIVMMIAFAQVSHAQEAKYQLSSHILDITTGKPAANVKIALAKQDRKGRWIKLDEKMTDDNGRIKDFLKEEEVGNDGIYKLTFFTNPYFTNLGEQSFYPFIEVVFEIKGNEHYHVPITLSPYGYSTYRGS